MNSSELPLSIGIQNVSSLLDYVVKTNYKARDGDAETKEIMKNCIALFGKDYKYSLIDNSSGDLCNHYPSQIVVLEYVKSDESLQDNVQSFYDANQLRKLVSGAKSARCRQRFAVPVILYEGKHICRAATISSGAEMYGRRVIDMFSGVENRSTVTTTTPDGTGNSTTDVCNDTDSELQMHDRIRGQDIRLLKFFHINYIFDLMLEMKKVKFGMNVTSSEKVDKENRYSEFLISSIPYPGCEFFRDWKDKGYRAEGLIFDWKQGFVDSYLELPSRPSAPPNIDWYKYSDWDLVTLTQNYLKLLVHYLREGDGGILVHCISGWDRTPLFVSLLRLSLWAEGVIHQTLSPMEILYLTIGYDWFLFGHNLPDRLCRGEEVFLFCFTFLKYISSDEYNITQRRSKRTVSTADSEGLNDGVLFDYDSRVDECHGSTSSISSVSSFNSTRSGVDVPQTQSQQSSVCFQIGSTDDELVMLNSSMQSSSVTLKAPSAARCSPCQDRPSSSSSSSSSQQQQQRTSPANCCVPSTSPVPVPCRPVAGGIQRLSNDLRVASMASYGSWQIISGLEGYRGVASPADSSRSSASEHADTSRRHSSSSSRESRESVRRQRLDEVRRTFLRLYRTLVDNGSAGSGICTSSSAASPDMASMAGGMLSGLFENFAEKVGLRSAARSGFV